MLTSLHTRIWNIWTYGAVYDRARWYTIVYGSRISPYTEQQSLSSNISVFLDDLRIRNSFLGVFRRICFPYTRSVYDLRISPFFPVNGRLRPWLFDLGIQNSFSKFSSILFNHSVKSNFIFPPISLNKKKEN